MLCAALDVAVARFRPIGHDAERHEPPALGGLDCRTHGCRERRLVHDDVIGRQHQQQRVDAGSGSARREQRRDRNGRRRISAYRLEHDRVRLDADLARLCDHELAMCGVANDDRRLHAEPERTRSKQRLLKQRRRFDERQELLRPIRAR